MTHDVFISYSSKDKPIADGICARMEADGLRCWIAPRDIDSGQDWPTAIANGIAVSKVMVLVFSQSSNMSEDVSRELYLAANNKVVIIPFVIENVKPEAGKAYYLGRTHWLDAMNPPTDEQIARLIERVHSIMAPAGSVGSVARVLDFGQRVHHKRPWAIPVALLLVAGLVIGGVSFFPKIMATFFPVGLPSSASVDPSFYLYREDFDVPEFDGAIPTTVRLEGDKCSNKEVVQGNGSLVFQTSADVMPDCSVLMTWGIEFKLNQIKAFEFAISTSPETPLNHLSFAPTLAGHDNSQKSLMLICGLNGSQSGCSVRSNQDELYQTRRFTVTPGESYVFRIEIVDPNLMDFRFALNGDSIGEFTLSPENALIYKDQNYFIFGGLHSNQNTTEVGSYFIDYLAIEQR